MEGIGRRVQIIKDRATVRYIGTVTGQEGIWVGVEWDDPSRGKHNGTSGGVKYFECDSGLNAGSFIRIEKVSFGCSLLEAVIARYTGQKGELGDVDQSEMYVHTAQNRKVNIHLVGEELIRTRQSQIQHLTSARVVGASVSNMDESLLIGSSLPSLTELDLTCNLLSSWEAVHHLCTALPKIQILNLSDNRIAIPASIAVDQQQLIGLRALVLNDCMMMWRQVLTLGAVLPNLDELHLCGNNIKSLISSENERDSDIYHLATTFSKLKLLNLEDNLISTWKDVQPLAALPNLSRLHLSNNPLSEVDYISNVNALAAASTSTSVPVDSMIPSAPDSGPGSIGPRSIAPGSIGSGSIAPGSIGSAGQTEPASISSASRLKEPFPCLECLLLGKCNLSDWMHVDQLGLFPVLKELRITGNPVLALSKSGGRFEVVGRIGGLKLLNGAEVRQVERRDAELRYLQNILAEVEEAPDADAKELVQRSHPRMQELVARYGAVLGTNGRAQQGSSMASNTIQLKLTCVATARGATMGSQVKKVPLSINIAALKLLCVKLFQVKAGQVTLFLRRPGDPVPEDMGSDEERPLSVLGIQDGCEVLVDECDSACAERR
ncbi:hypothetical protein CEUSTIGMA_g11305.t1 [Chlamydomonas eustigma]|uniref:CAP-Gly domain-containing protein n=1 Tax=Chlamydomonas eustigma TaxID=1157962 RepID=A0A250XM65_9CHLO|nr:hypothetical protein CEUSTIGMA_g11305.t1 [Chlamydomonas eustigma]|eukprot:GAX83880.1 hypothetical protein CEUSTIGMA_g11305.t1 [Chlamydomonas eustigma]